MFTDFYHISETKTIFREHNFEFKKWTAIFEYLLVL